MQTLHIDFETQSNAKLPTVGSDCYSRHPSTRVHCAAWVIGDNPADIQIWRSGEPIPSEWTAAGTIVCAHNVNFERSIWRNTLGLPEPAGWEDTMAMAAAANMPLSLDQVARWLRLPELKDKEGYALMMKMSRSSYTPADGEFQRLCEYCRQDVVVELEVYRKLSGVMSDVEKRVFVLDQQINANGIHVDVETAASVLEVVESEKNLLAAELIEMSDDTIQTGTQTARILKWLQGRGVKINSLTAAEVAEVLTSEELTPQTRRMLQIRQCWALGSIGKYKTMLDSNTDGVLRDLFTYCGASQTGRWAGRRVQAHNLPRSSYSDDQIETAISMFRARDAAGIRWAFGDVFGCAKSLLRSMFHEPSGLVVSDFAQIEARVLAWLAGQLDLVDDFQNARPVYEKMASKIYGVPIDQVTKTQRQAGKGVILGAGYGMGPNKFALVAKGLGIIATANEAAMMVNTYRSTYPCIPSLWRETGNAFLEAMKHNSPIEIAGRLEVQQVSPRTLRCRLPSGRFLFWHSAKVVEGEYGPEILYRSAAGNISKTYGANIVENVCQAISRDLLAAAMLRLDSEGYDVCMHVHDEVVIRGANALDTKDISDIMSDSPSWAAGLPVACETNHCPTNRYTK